jgi:hypothetical protein
MITNFKFYFSAEQIRNEFMTLDIQIDSFKQSIEVAKNFEFTIDINLPATILFHLNKRNHDDTIVQNDKIIADKFIRLDSLEIDGFFVNSYQLPEDKFYFDSKNGRFSTEYWSRNGTASLIIDNDDPALWLLDCPKII